MSDETTKPEAPATPMGALLDVLRQQGLATVLVLVVVFDLHQAAGWLAPKFEQLLTDIHVAAQASSAVLENQSKDVERATQAHTRIEQLAREARDAALRTEAAVKGR